MEDRQLKLNQIQLREVKMKRNKLNNRDKRKTNILIKISRFFDIPVNKIEAKHFDLYAQVNKGFIGIY
jgi:hypothetical protein